MLLPDIHPFDLGRNQDRRGPRGGAGAALRAAESNALGGSCDSPLLEDTSHESLVGYSRSPVSLRSTGT